MLKYKICPTKETQSKFLQAAVLHFKQMYVCAGGKWRIVYICEGINC